MCVYTCIMYCVYMYIVYCVCVLCVYIMCLVLGLVTDPVFYYPDICSQQRSDTQDNWFKKIHDSKYTVLPHLFAVMNYNRCLYKQHWCFYRSFCTLKAGNMEQNTYQSPFYGNFDFTCLVSAHAQTLNEYLDTKKHIRRFSSQILSR